MRRWLKEPLLHFAILGIGFFALYRVISPDAGVESDEIVVDARRISTLAEQFARSWRRPPTAVELEGLIDSYVRDEVLYREGLTLGLDRDDPVIRSRVRLKMEVLSDGPDAEVSEAELQAWLDADLQRYAAPTRYDIEQVFFDPTKRGAQLDANVAAALGHLQATADVDPATLGDSTLLPVVLGDVTRAEIASQFGEEFATALTDVPPGRWFGPVASVYGEHLVKIDIRAEPKAAVLADVREAVERDVQYARSQTANDALYERIRSRYTVRIERPADGAVGAAVAAETQ